MTDKKVPLAQRHAQANYWFNFKRDPSSVEPSPEDIKCELQLQALSDFERLKFDIDYDEFKKQMKPMRILVSYLQREGLSNQDKDYVYLVYLVILH